MVQCSLNFRKSFDTVALERYPPNSIYVNARTWMDDQSDERTQGPIVASLAGCTVDTPQRIHVYINYLPNVCADVNI